MAGYCNENVTSRDTHVKLVFTHYHFRMCLTFAALASQMLSRFPLLSALRKLDSTFDHNFIICSVTHNSKFNGLTELQANQ